MVNSTQDGNEANTVTHHSHEDHLSEWQELEQERDYYKNKCEELEKELKRINDIYFRDAES